MAARGVRSSWEASETKRVIRSWATTWAAKELSFWVSIVLIARCSEPTSVVRGSVTRMRADRSPCAIRAATLSIWRRERNERWTR